MISKGLPGPLLTFLSSLASENGSNAVGALPTTIFAGTSGDAVEQLARALVVHLQLVFQAREELIVNPSTLPASRAQLLYRHVEVLHGRLTFLLDRVVAVF